MITSRELAEMIGTLLQESGLITHHRLLRVGDTGEDDVRVFTHKPTKSWRKVGDPDWRYRILVVIPRFGIILQDGKHETSLYRSYDFEEPNCFERLIEDLKNCPMV